MERMHPGWWRPCLALLPAIAGIGFCGVDLAHTDLSVQRTLIAVRRAPHSLPGDLVADHAAAHPGLWLDLLALLPGTPSTETTLSLALSMATLLSAAAWLKLRTPALLSLAVGTLAVVLSRDLPGFVDTLPSAPISRAAVLPAVLASWALASSTHHRWAGLTAGLAIAIHPAIGASGAVLAGAMSRQPLRLFALACAVGFPVLGPPLLFSTTAFSAHQAAAVAWRWGHHLDLFHGLPITVFMVLWTLHRAVRATGRDKAVAGVALLLIVFATGAALGVTTGLLPADLARLHPLHFLVPVACWVLLDAASRLSTRRVPALLASVLLLLLGVGAPPGWRSTPAPVPPEVIAWCADLPSDRLVAIDPRQAGWARNQLSRGVYVSVKDGGEVVGDRRFVERWATRLAESCSAEVPPTPQWSPGPGWTRVRMVCSPPERPDQRDFFADRLAVLQVPRASDTRGWHVIADDAEWIWIVPSERIRP